MKKIIVALVLGSMLLSSTSFAQENSDKEVKAEKKSTMFNGETNLQLFYDFGGDRQHFTSTLEGLYFDPWGDTFFFVDIDYTTKARIDQGLWGPKGAYFEISRGINFWKDTKFKNLSGHIEYNGGINFGSSNWLFGANYDLITPNGQNVFKFELMFKTFNGSARSNCPLQFTFVWAMNDIFNVKGLCFKGFADVWGENTPYWYGETDPSRQTLPEGHFIFISEPQLWYSVGQFWGMENFNVGTELEASINFAGCRGFRLRPCLGLKWIF